MLDYAPEAIATYCGMLMDNNDCTVYGWTAWQHLLPICAFEAFFVLLKSHHLDQVCAVGQNCSQNMLGRCIPLSPTFIGHGHFKLGMHTIKANV